MIFLWIQKTPRIISTTETIEATVIIIVCVKVVRLVDSEDSICESCNVALDAFSADVSDCEEICGGSCGGLVGSGSELDPVVVVVHHIQTHHSIDCNMCS